MNFSTILTCKCLQDDGVHSLSGSGFIAASLISLTVIVVYIVWLLYKAPKLDGGKFRKYIITFVIIISGLYLLMDLHVMSSISEPVHKIYDIVPLFPLAVLHSVEVFIFQTHFFDNGYEEFFFLGKPFISAFPNQLVLIIMVTLAALAVSTSVSLLFRAVGKRRADRNWLSSHSNQAHQTHIFLQGGEYSTYLAEDIKHIPDSITVLVDFPNPDSGSVGLSLLEKIKKFISLEPSAKGPFDSVVYAKNALSELKGLDLYSELGLKELQPYFEDERCSLYLLGTDENLNFKVTQFLNKAGCKAGIYCRASRESANRMYEEALSSKSHNNFRIVDASYLAVRELKSRVELLPVNFVTKGTDNDGNKEGWVASAFNSMILGFGEIGREALKFLYEHAAFVGKDLKKSPFKCIAIDSRADELEMEFTNKFPGMFEKNCVSLKQMDVETSAFWELIKEEIGTLNYVVVCTGNDKLNLRVSVELLEYSYRAGRDLSDNFVILVALKNPSVLDLEAIKHYNSISEYCNCLHIFAVEKDLWTYDNISNISYRERAKKYFTGYLSSQGITTEEASVQWELRENDIHQVENFALHLNSIRKKQQDYANVFHIPTKLALVGDEILMQKKKIADEIPAKYTDRHYLGNDAHIEKVLLYLAVGEHIRWEASHAALGYRPGKTTDVLLKTHQYILDYEKLNSVIKHYDYLVVKTTLGLE